MTLLSVRDLTKHFPIKRGIFGQVSGQVRAVDGVSFEVAAGETLALVGESGCGKSTTGRAVLRLIEPTSGSVNFDGNDVLTLGASDLRRLRRKMQIVFQDPFSSLNPRMTIGAAVREGLTIHRLAEGAEADARVRRLLDEVGLRAEYAQRYPHEFSGGQRQRVGIARALAVGPDLLACDEPVSALDVSVQAQVINLLERLQEELGLCMLFISHDLRVVQYTAHRTAVMYLGRIVEMGATADVAEKRYHPYTRALFSAIPSLTPDGKKRLVLQGEPPSAMDPPKGCAFHPRCPSMEKGRCDVEAPTLEELVPGSHHRVACWHPEMD